MQDVQDLFEWDAGNPLLAALPAERSFLEWGEILEYDPRRNWSRPFGPRPESHAHQIEHLFVPTELSIGLCMSLHAMLVQSLRKRDARVAANRRRVYEIGLLDAKKLGDDLEKMPWFSDGATGAILQGPTGVTKSQSILAFLRHFPHVIEHGPNEECGWSKLKQLVYLRVFLPDDANRRTLYLTIVKGIDEALGTDHYASISERMKNGALLLFVLLLLTLYRCGMLILEEAQVRNLGPQILGKEFLVTFLRILNCGIPVILVGNPVAFGNVLEFSQDMRRFSCTGIFNFYPVYAAGDAAWRSDFVPQVWGWTVLDEAEDKIPEQELCNLLYKRSGGVIDFLSRYRRECLVVAIRLGATRVTRAHMEVAWHSPSMLPLHDLIDALVTKDITKLAKFSDMPLAFLSSYWSAEGAKRKAQNDAKKVT